LSLGFAPSNRVVSLSVKVYAYLKRLGFVLTRAKPPTSDYPAALPLLPRHVTVPGMWKRITVLLSHFASNVLNVIGFVLQRSPWKAVGLRSLKSSGSFFFSFGSSCDTFIYRSLV